MSIRYKWDDDLIMHITLEHPWTWAEYLVSARAIKVLIDDIDHPCATIVDATLYGELPKDGTPIQILLKIDTLLSQNLFATVLVGAPQGVKAFLMMIMKLRPHMQKIAFFTDTVEEARAKILERSQHKPSDGR